MKDTEYKAEKKRVELYLSKWSYLFQDWYFHHTWEREYESGSGYSSVATTMAKWEYRRGYFTWYLPMLLDKSDSYVEGIVVHELAHILISATQNMRTKADTQMTEYATTCVADALMKVHSAKA